MRSGLPQLFPWLAALAVAGLSPSAGAQTLTVSSSSLAFGKVVVGSTSPGKSVTVKNGTTTAIAIGSVTSSLADYTRTTNCPTGGSALAAGASCSVTVKFTPAALGSRTAALA